MRTANEDALRHRHSQTHAHCEHHMHLHGGVEHTHPEAADPVHRYDPLIPPDAWDHHKI